MSYDNTAPMGVWPVFGFEGRLQAGENAQFLHPNGEQGEVHIRPSPDHKWLWIFDTSTTALAGSGPATRFSRKKWTDSDLISGWEDVSGLDAVKSTIVDRTPEKPNQDGNDTPSYLWHPVNRQHLLYNTYSPGNLAQVQPAATGIRSFTIGVSHCNDFVPGMGLESMQRTFDNVLDNVGVSWAQEFVPNSVEPLVYEGGLTEPSAFWVPELQRVGMLVTGITGVTDGMYTWSLGHTYSDDGITNWDPLVKNWDPDAAGTPANDIYTTITPGFRGAWQQECIYDPVAKGVHMVCMISSGQSVAAKIGYFWSPGYDFRAWYAHPNNPVLTLSMPNGPQQEGEFGHMATPTIFIDWRFKRLVVVVSGSNNNRGAGQDWFYAASARWPYVTKPII